MKRLLAQLHLPLDSQIPFIHRVLGETVGPMDGSVFSFRRAGELINAYALWETLEPVTLGRGATGKIVVYPHTPEIWQHLNAGETLFWLLPEYIDPISAQILEPLTEVTA